MVKLEKRVQEYVLKYNIANDVNVVFSDTKSMVTFLENEKSILSELTEVGNFDLSFEQVDDYLKQLEEVEEMLKDFSNNTTKQYFTEEEMHERIIEILEDYDREDVLDYHEVSEQLNNYQDYIVYYSEAKEALHQYDVFTAIETIKNYENHNFGEVTTDFSCPNQVANMLWYVLSEEYMNDIDLYSFETVGEALDALQ